MQKITNDLSCALIHVLEQNKKHINKHFKPKKELLNIHDKWIEAINTAETIDFDQLKKFILSIYAFSDKSTNTIRLQNKEIVCELIGFMKNVNVSEQKESNELENIASNITNSLELKTFEDMKSSIQTSLQSIKKVLSAKENSRAQIKKLTNKITTISKDLEQSQKQLKKDLFTDLHNKVSFTNELKKIVSISHAEKNKTLNHLLVFLDIDDFKHINDTYGHQKGDMAILTLSKLLKLQALQTEGFAARFGGDEFAITCKVMNIESATRFTKNLMEKIRLLKIKTNDGYFNLTCSIGASLLKSGEDDYTWLNHTDKALYHAKGKGKNTFVLFMHK